MTRLRSINPYTERVSADCGRSVLLKVGEKYLNYKIKCYTSQIYTTFYFLFSNIYSFGI